MKNFSLFLILMVSFTGCRREDSGKNGSDQATIEFIQWWENEMPEGTLAALIQEFEEENPKISVKLVSLPYAEVQDQILVQGAGGTLPEVVGIDPSRIKSFIQFGFVEKLDPFILRDSLPKGDYALKEVDGESWMMPVTSYVYPLYYNRERLRQAGFDTPPQSREEFLKIVAAVSNPPSGEYGFVIPLSLNLPNGAVNDIMPFAWSGGFETIVNGTPNLTSQEFIDVLQMVNNMFESEYLSPGTLSKREPEKVEEFANGRVAMMISSTAHINLIRERNPNLDFGITAIPGPGSFDGSTATQLVGWDIGISAKAEERKKEAAWELIKFLTRSDINSRISSYANAFPGNLNSSPDFVLGDPLFQIAEEILTSSRLVSPLVGLPETQELQRVLNEEIHTMLTGKSSPDEAAAAAQKIWSEIIHNN